MNFILTKTTAKDTLIASLIRSITTFFVFAAFEPSILMSATASDQFTISTSVTSEISFSTTASDVNLAALPGITGGMSTGATQIVVLTNNAAGYSMTLKASSSPALQGDSQGGSVSDYTPTVGTVPDYGWSVPANTAEFGYTVSASTTTDLDQSFLDNGADTCNTGSADTTGSASCWLNASTTDETIINRSSETSASGATTTIFFRLQIQSDPVPVIPEDTYTATTTLTATTN